MGRETLITSRNNPIISHYRELCQKKRSRRTEKLFPAEGLRLVREAVQANAAGDILLTEAAWERYGEEFPDAWRISDALGDFISETEHPQGVFAVCRIPERPAALSADGRCVVLHELQDPGNMGMILRTADALGVDAVISCKSCDVYSPKVVRATMGAIFRMPVYEFSDAAQVSDFLRERGITSYAAVLHRDALPVTDLNIGKGSAVWIGNEGNGLSEDAVSVCEHKIIIPMQGHAESLNAAMAAGILMWEVMKNGSAGA